MRRFFIFRIFSRRSPSVDIYRDYLYQDQPLVPWALGDFDYESLLDEFHTKPLAQLLEAGNPELFQRWYHVVFKAAYAVKNAEAELDSLYNEQDKLAEQVGALEGSLANLPEVYDNPEDDFIPLRYPEKPTLPPWHNVLTIGLSLMLFLGISEYFGLDIQSLSLEQLPILVLAVLGASCINLAEYIGITKMVKATRRYDPRRSPQDDTEHLDILHFLARFRAGDSANWLALTMIVLETSFAAPGLIALLPPKAQADPLFKFTVIAACGLAALVNLVMAWSNALEEIHWEQITNDLHERERQERMALRQEQQHQERKERLHQEQKNFADQKKKLSEQLQSATSGISQKQAAITRQQSLIAIKKEEAVLEFRRWERSVREWMRENPEKLEHFQQVYPIWQERVSENGHKPDSQKEASQPL